MNRLNTAYVIINIPDYILFTRASGRNIRNLEIKLYFKALCWKSDPLRYARQQSHLPVKLCPPPGGNRQCLYGCIIYLFTQTVSYILVGKDILPTRSFCMCVICGLNVRFFCFSDDEGMIRYESGISPCPSPAFKVGSQVRTLNSEFGWATCPEDCLVSVWVWQSCGF